MELAPLGFDESLHPDIGGDVVRDGAHGCRKEHRAGEADDGVAGSKARLSPSREAERGQANVANAEIIFDGHGDKWDGSSHLAASAGIPRGLDLLEEVMTDKHKRASVQWPEKSGKNGTGHRSASRRPEHRGCPALSHG